MKRFRLLTTALTGLLLTTAWPVLAHEEQHEAFGGNTGAPSELTVTPDGQRAIGLETRLATRGELAQVLSVTGQVQAAENRSFDISPGVPGTVRGVYVQQGDTVRAGQTLAVIDSVEVADALARLQEERARLKSELAQTRTRYQGEIAVQENEVALAGMAFQREERLLGEGITARKDFQAAESAYRSAQARLSSLKQQSVQQAALLQKQLSLAASSARARLRAMGLSDATASRVLSSGGVVSGIPVVSPVSGTVTSRDITVGEAIMPGTKAFSVVNLSPVWVVVNVYQEQIAGIRTGQQVQIQTPTNQQVRGTISNIGAVVDPQQRTLSVRIVSDNPGHVLRPGMFVTAGITTGKTGRSGVLVPTAAIIEDGGASWVYIRNGNRFRPAEVRVGERTPEQAEILSGVREGDEVVIQGARQLQAQAMLNAAGGGPEHHSGHSHDHEGRDVPWSALLLGGLIGGIIVGGGVGWYFLKARRGPDAC